MQPKINELCRFACRRSIVSVLRFDALTRVKYTTSATEQEIVHRGLLDASEDFESVFRTIEDLPTASQSAEFIDLNSDGVPDTQASAMLEDLKDRLRKRLNRNVHEYTTRWDDAARASTYIDQLCR